VPDIHPNRSRILQAKQICGWNRCHRPQMKTKLFDFNILTKNTLSFGSVNEPIDATKTIAGARMWIA
jgi:hypothetical protein